MREGLCLVLLLALGGTAWAQSAPDDPSAPLRISPMRLTARATPLADGLTRRGTWSSAQVAIANGGPTALVQLSLSGRGPDGSESVDYLRSVEVPTGTIKRVSLPYRVEDGRSKRTILLSSSIAPPSELELLLRPLSARDYAIGVIGDDAMGVQALVETWERDVPGLGYSDDGPREVNVGLLELGSLPDQLWSYDALNTLVWPDAEPSSLRPEQLSAITQWVAKGGHLVLTVSDTWGSVSASPLAEVLPATLSAPEDGSLAPLYRQFLPSRGQRTLPPAPVAVATLRGEPIVVAGDEERPLWIVGPYGLGAVTLLTASPAVAPLSEDREALWRALLWLPTPDAQSEPRAMRRLPTDHQRVLRQALHMRPDDDEATDDTHSNWVIRLNEQLSDMPGVAPLPIGWLVLLSMLYLLLIGPVDYLTLKRLNRQPWTWVTFPAIIAAFTTFALVGTSLYKGNQAVAIQQDHITVLPRTGLVHGSTYLGVFTTRKTDLVVGAESAQETVRPFEGGGYMNRPSVRFSGGPSALAYHGETWTLGLVQRDWVGRNELGEVTGSFDGSTLHLHNGLVFALDEAEVFRDDVLWSFARVEPGADTSVTQLPARRACAEQFDPSADAPFHGWWLCARVDHALRPLNITGLAPESQAASWVRVPITLTEDTTTSGVSP